jgi:hypothetical protein
MAAAALPSKSLTLALKGLRGQLLKSQPRTLFKHESDSRRWQIVELICDQGWSVRLFTKSRKSESVARSACLEAIVQYASEIGSVRIVLGVDDSVIQEDKTVLWVTDAIAWCASRVQHNDPNKARSLAHRPFLTATRLTSCGPVPEAIPSLNGI